jgi:cbb3-type cytochrome oxidase maturation protein
MTILALLIPASLLLGGLGLAAFLWSLRGGQYEDLEGAAHRILIDDGDRPYPAAEDAGTSPGARSTSASVSDSISTR